MFLDRGHPNLNLNFSRLFWSLTPERDVWIREPQMPSSDVTARKLGSDFDWLAVKILHKWCENYLPRVFNMAVALEDFRRATVLLVFVLRHWVVKNYIPIKKAHYNSSYEEEMCSWIYLQATESRWFFKSPRSWQVNFPNRVHSSSRTVLFLWLFPPSP